jgi:phosphatidylserine/phosphatidylglycerophosphate/cardiolipin synthase-like enzyme
MAKYASHMPSAKRASVMSSAKRVGHLASLLLLALASSQCKTPGEVGDYELRATDGAADGVLSLPTLTNPADYEDLVEAELAGTDVPANKKVAFAKRIAHYLAFLGADQDTASAKNILDRIMDGSTQYILCDSFQDWECLEATPAITPKTKMRRDVEANLGKPVVVGEPLKIESFFTDAWDVEKENIVPNKMLAVRLAEKIKAFGNDGIDVAIYGIDESNGSMKPVFDALMGRIQSGTKIRAVVDTLDFRDEVDNFPQIFSYKKPSGQKAWVFDELDEKSTNLNFQYKDTVKLIHALNKGISDDEQARGRVEWPNGSGIMHNKFLVFLDGQDMRVWTGTANIADTCMGTERNTNVGVFIDNDEVAEEFAREFEEMFTYREISGGDKLLNAKSGEKIKVGRFHTQKTANTKRYFKFSDGSELRLHFAPTDDGEHRAIIPMLLSAKKGDVIRVAMFGAGGQEFIRAFQYAAAKGADVRIVLDRLTGSQTVGWLRDPAGNLLDKNPYDATPSGTVTVRRSTWKKQNHHKSATLTREGGKPEVIIIGSQNWSKQGNDVNDENMITVRKLDGAPPVAEEFNAHFDARLWKLAAAGELKVGIPYKQQVDAAAAEAEAAEEE